MANSFATSAISGAVDPLSPRGLHHTQSPNLFTFTLTHSRFVTGTPFNNAASRDDVVTLFDLNESAAALVDLLDKANRTLFANTASTNTMTIRFYDNKTKNTATLELKSTHTPVPPSCSVSAKLFIKARASWAEFESTETNVGPREAYDGHGVGAGSGAVDVHPHKDPPSNLTRVTEIIKAACDIVMFGRGFEWARQTEIHDALLPKETAASMESSCCCVGWTIDREGDERRRSAEVSRAPPSLAGLPELHDAVIPKHVRTLWENLQHINAAIVEHVATEAERATDDIEMLPLGEVAWCVTRLLQSTGTELPRADNETMRSIVHLMLLNFVLQAQGAHVFPRAGPEWGLETAIAATTAALKCRVLVLRASSVTKKIEFNAAGRRGKARGPTSKSIVRLDSIPEASDSKDDGGEHESKSDVDGTVAASSVRSRSGSYVHDKDDYVPSTSGSDSDDESDDYSDSDSDNEKDTKRDRHASTEFVSLKRSTNPMVLTVLILQVLQTTNSSSAIRKIQCLVSAGPTTTLLCVRQTAASGSALTNITIEAHAPVADTTITQSFQFTEARCPENDWNRVISGLFGMLTALGSQHVLLPITTAQEYLLALSKTNYEIEPFWTNIKTGLLAFRAHQTGKDNSKQNTKWAENTMRRASEIALLAAEPHRIVATYPSAIMALSDFEEGDGMTHTAPTPWSAVGVAPFGTPITRYAVDAFLCAQRFVVPHHDLAHRDTDTLLVMLAAANRLSTGHVLDVILAMTRLRGATNIKTSTSPPPLRPTFGRGAGAGSGAEAASFTSSVLVGTGKQPSWFSGPAVFVANKSKRHEFHATQHLYSTGVPGCVFAFAVGVHPSDARTKPEHISLVLNTGRATGSLCGDRFAKYLETGIVDVSLLAPSLRAMAIAMHRACHPQAPGAQVYTAVMVLVPAQNGTIATATVGPLEVVTSGALLTHGSSRGTDTGDVGCTWSETAVVTIGAVLHVVVPRFAASHGPAGWLASGHPVLGVARMPPPTDPAHELNSVTRKMDTWVRTKAAVYTWCETTPMAHLSCLSDGSQKDELALPGNIMGSLCKMLDRVHKHPPGLLFGNAVAIAELGALSPVRRLPYGALGLGGPPVCTTPENLWAAAATTVRIAYKYGHLPEEQRDAFYAVATFRVVVLALQLGIAKNAPLVTDAIPVRPAPLAPETAVFAWKKWTEFQTMFDAGKVPVRPWDILNVPKTTVFKTNPALLRVRGGSPASGETLFLPLPFAQYMINTSLFRQPVSVPHVDVRQVVTMLGIQMDAPKRWLLTQSVTFRVYAAAIDNTLRLLHA